jgi:hypothetical protein
MLAKIYQPARGATQSGMGKSQVWVLEFAPEEGRRIDPLMGWTSSSDMNSQLRLTFGSRDEAVAYATGKGLAFQVEEPKPRRPVIRPGGYGDNFAYARKQAWTH